MSGEFTIKDFQSICDVLCKQQPPKREFQLVWGLQQKIVFDFFVALDYYKNKDRFFPTDTKVANDYVEYTPYNKGNLWKIRLYFNKIDVYYGTKKKAYTTNIQDALKFINS